MKIFKWTFTRQNTYDFLSVVAKYMVPSGIGGIIIGNIFKDPTIAASAMGLINAGIYFLQLLFKPATSDNFKY